ncbi:MAG: hypothetical protein JSU85_13560 [Candidatus Zixiibacteriota bacterium]|nr:MAG: hypothetical protein JSU85_13560 [candidate division Zixibacteria bacterium]
MKTLKYKNRILLPVIAIFAIWAVNCSKDDKTSGPHDNDGIVHLDIRGDCLNVPSSAQADSGYMVLEAVGNDLHIHHMDAYYNCCIAYAVDYRIDNFDIAASELDTADSPCYCDCYFNLESILYNLDHGLYNVALIGIHGDTVGIDTVTVGG